MAAEVVIAREGSVNPINAERTKERLVSRYRDEATEWAADALGYTNNSWVNDYRGDEVHAIRRAIDNETSDFEEKLQDTLDKGGDAEKLYDDVSWSLKEKMRRSLKQMGFID